MELTLEQQLSLKIASTQLEKASAEQARELCLDLMRQNMMLRNFWKAEGLRHNLLGGD